MKAGDPGVPCRVMIIIPDDAHKTSLIDWSVIIILVRPLRLELLFHGQVDSIGRHENFN